MTPGKRQGEETLHVGKLGRRGRRELLGALALEGAEDSLDTGGAGSPTQFMSSFSAVNRNSPKL